MINRVGIARDRCEDAGCTGDGLTFKGPYVRGLSALNAVTGGRYTGYLNTQAASAYAQDRTGIDQYGQHWAGPLVESEAPSQGCAVDLMNAT